MHRALIVLDGLGDLPNPETGGRTPTDAAATPHLDGLAQRGRLGLVDLLGPGIAPESDAGVIALLGLDPVTDSPGRGVLEALGIGLPLSAGDIALRLNFATSDGDGNIIDSRVGRSLGTTEAASLARALTEADLLEDHGVRAEVRATVGHRGVLWLHPREGGPLSPAISNSDPFYAREGGMGKARPRVGAARPEPVRAMDGSAAALRTADLVETFLSKARPILVGHSVNAKRALGGRPMANDLLLRHAGTLPSTGPGSFEARTGWHGAAITEMPVERGIARWLGLDDRFVGPMGPDRAAALTERAAVTRQALADHDFVYVHQKGPDEPGHDGRARAKQEVIEAIDRSFFGPFLDGLDLATHRILVTADHSTPCALMAHSDDPVPTLLAGQGIEPAPGSPGRVKFGESAAASGALGRLRGNQALALLDGAGRRPA
ncbi:MAG TPA: alkaline phosphatase family protein [Thermoplasmata archaeon]|nr:alkaline phosphatase family protein [Thermoplasmata archaeon]